MFFFQDIIEYVSYDLKEQNLSSKLVKVHDKPKTLK